MLSSNSTLAASFSSLSSGYYSKIVENQNVDAIKQEGMKRLAGLKPWSDFFAMARFQKPTDYTSFRKRFDFNLIYFQNNYLLISFIVVAWFLISNIWLLVGAAAAVGASKYIQSLPSNQPTLIFGQPFLPMQLWIVYSITFFIWFWFTGVTSSLLYVVGVCTLLIAAHAGSIDKPIEAEFADEGQMMPV